MKNCRNVLMYQAKIRKLMFDLARKRNGKVFLSGRAREKIEEQIQVLRQQVR